jgi:hypothetical protein
MVGVPLRAGLVDVVRVALIPRFEHGNAIIADKFQLLRHRALLSTPVVRKNVFSALAGDYLECTFEHLRVSLLIGVAE